MRMPLSLFLPKIRGWPCSRAMVWSSRTSFSVSVSQAPSLKMLQFCRISMNAVPLCAAACLSVALRCGWNTSTERATNVASAPSASESGIERPVHRAVRRGLGLLADLGRRRILALGQPVDPVVEQQHLEPHVAAQHVDEVVAADGQRVAVARGDPHVEVRPRDLQPRGDRRRAPVDGVEAVGVHVVREAAGAADAGDDHRSSRAGCPAREARSAPRRGWRSRRSPGTSGLPGPSGSPSSCRPEAPRSSACLHSRVTSAESARPSTFPCPTRRARRLSAGPALPRSWLRSPATLNGFPWTLFSPRVHQVLGAQHPQQLAQVHLRHQHLLVALHDVAQVRGKRIQVAQVHVADARGPSPAARAAPP